MGDGSPGVTGKAAIMIEFWQRYNEKLVNASIEHLQLVVLAVGAAFLICIPLFLAAQLSPKVNVAITAIINAIYTIPGMALFALCVPVVGIGRPAALLALTLYNLFVIFKNISIGFGAVSPSLLEAGKGMGYSTLQLFAYIKLPQAMPSIFAGLKLASTMTVGTATIASIVNGGGFGRLMFDGLKRRYMGEILWVTLVSIIMALIFNNIFQWLEDSALKRAQGERRNKK